RSPSPPRRTACTGRTGPSTREYPVSGRAGEPARWPASVERGHVDVEQVAQGRAARGGDAYGPARAHPADPTAGEELLAQPRPGAGGWGRAARGAGDGGGGGGAAAPPLHDRDVERVAEPRGPRLGEHEPVPRVEQAAAEQRIGDRDTEAAGEVVVAGPAAYQR